jgi:hypothetical protein
VFGGFSFLSDAVSAIVVAVATLFVFWRQQAYTVRILVYESLFFAAVERTFYLFVLSIILYFSCIPLCIHVSEELSTLFLNSAKLLSTLRQLFIISHH